MFGEVEFTTINISKWIRFPLLDISTLWALMYDHICDLRNTFTEKSFRIGRVRTDNKIRPKY